MEYKDLDSISKSNLPGYKNIYALNGYNIPLNKDVFHKYIPLTYLKGYISNRQITFVSPASWSDPFETRYHDINYKNIGYTKPRVFCMCLTTKQACNEDAMWIRYSKPGDEMVKINISIADLLKLLDDQGSQMGFKTFIGEVIYLSKTDIMKITRKDKRFFPTQFDIEHYLSLMSLKRIAFSYENEVRIFIKPDDRATPPPLFYNVKETAATSICTIINKITVSPYPVDYVPFPNPDSQILLEVRKSKTAASFPGIQVEASRLFENCPKCKL